MSHIIIRDARYEDVQSMVTIIPRAYATDALLPRIIPSTPTIQEWWRQTYYIALSDAKSCIIVAVDGDQTVGLLTLHYHNPECGPSTSNVITSTVPLTPDHSPSFADGIRRMIQERDKVVGKVPNYLIELLCVDQEYQRMGVGRRLVERACAIADERSAAIFLQTSAAKDYYTRRLQYGFEAIRHDTDDQHADTIIRPRMF